MKKNISLFIAIFTIGLLSCSKDTTETPATTTPDVGATIDVVIGTEASSATKVSYTSNSDGSEFAFSWHSGDEISVVVPDVAGNSNSLFSAETATSTSNLSGQLLSWSGSYDLYAIFPYKSSGYSVSSGAIYYSLADQVVDASSSNLFENGLMTAVAYDAMAVSSDDYSISTLSFKQVMSFYQLSLKDIPTDETVVKIGFEASSNLFVESATVDLAEATISGKTMTSAISATVSNASGTSVTLNFAIFPVDLSSQSITMCVTTMTSDGYNVYSRVFSSAANFERNTFIHHGEEFSLADFEESESDEYELADFSAASYPKDSDVWHIVDETATLADFYGLRYALYSAYDEGREITVIAENLTEIPAGSWTTGAFYGCNALVAVEMPAVTTIGNYTFRECTFLESISSPNLEKMGYYAFFSCASLKSLSLSKLTTIEDSAFYGCKSLESISLPAVTEIGAYAFLGCVQLSSVYLPEVKIVGNEYEGELGEGVFHECTSLKTISLPKATILGSGTFAYCSSLETVELPEVASIYSEVFYSCTSLKTISLPSADYIAYYAFNNCTNLESVYIPSVTTIGNYPFFGCGSLTTLEVNSEYFTFEDCVLYDVNKTEILFALESISGDYVAPTSVVTISDYAFYNCGALESIVASSAQTIGNSAFCGCGALESIVAPSAQTIGERAFYDCDALESIVATSVQTIGNHSFYSCDALTTASFPMVTTVGYYAFFKCDKLASVYLPAATDIGTIVFSYCSSLTSLAIATNDGVVINTFGGLSSMFIGVTLSDLTLTLDVANASMVDGLYFNAPYNGSSYAYGPFKEIILTGGVSTSLAASGEKASGAILGW